MMADTKPKRGRGRPRKDPNDTTTAPYVLHRFEPTGKVGRPKKNPYAGSGWGGAREGSGREAYLSPAEKKTAQIIFRCEEVVRKRYDLLKAGGFDISDALRKYINKMAKIRLGPDDVPDDWTPPKKK